MCCWITALSKTGMSNYFLPRKLNIKLNSRAKLEGCILGKNTKVGSKADVVRSITQAGYEISAGGEWFLLALHCHGLT